MKIIKDYRPDFLTSSDHHWLSDIVDTYRRCNGLTLRHVHSVLEASSVPKVAKRRLDRVKKLLDKRVCHVEFKTSARELRMISFSKLFDQTARPVNQSLTNLLQEVGRELNISEDAVSRLLLSDIDGEQTIDTTSVPNDLSELCNQVNLVFAKSLLRKSSAVVIQIPENSRRVIRQAKLKGLICNVARTREGLLLHISGPLSLLRKTSIYGNGLASLLDGLIWCNQFNLTAVCQRYEESFRVKLESGDPIRPGTRPKSFDSKLEEKFAAAVAKKLPGWRLRREPEPIDTAEGTIFPDFLLEYFADSNLGFFCEIVGFWTPQYIQKKLRQWSLIEGCRFVLCVSENLKVAEDFLPEHVPIYFFKNCIDPKKLIDIVYGGSHP